MVKPVASLRLVSILIGIIIGAILVYAYHVSFVTLPDQLEVTSLIVFASIPLFVGLLVGFFDPEKALKDGVLVGFVIGVFNSVVAAVKFIFLSTLTVSEVYSFALFAIVSIFAWTVLAGAAAMLASKLYE